MPFVQIHLPAHFTAETQKAVSLSVHESLVQAFQIPEDDYFQVIHAAAPGGLLYPPSYMNIPHTPNLVYVHITAKPGRTVEMKQALYRLIADKIAASTPVAADDVIIILSETPVENWSFGQGIAQLV